jgi:hypothetical protein
MAWNLAYLETRLSGGASNAVVTNSLGGAKSSEIVRSKTCSAPSNVTGVTILDAPGSSNGSGTLSYTASGTLLTWTPAGGSASVAVNVGTDGRYALKGVNAGATDGYLFVSVTAASLPGSNVTDTITVASAVNKMWEDILPAESYAGQTDYHGFYVHNAHPSIGLIDCKLYIASQTSGVDALWIGLGTSAIDATEQTIANDTTAPSGVTFSQPSSVGAAISLGALGAGQHRAYWQKRVCPATNVADTADVSQLMLVPTY